MKNEEEAAEAALVRFYEAIEAIVSGQGLEPMENAWWHDDRVTGGHPSGEWAQGWEEVWATWQVFGSFGRHDRAGSKVESLKVHVYGDIAYATVLFRASPAWGAETLACTNVLQRRDGVWKIIHHHADKSPAMAKALEEMIAQG